MRHGSGILGFFFALTLASPALAQQQDPKPFVPWSDAASFLNGINPGNRIYKPIDTSNVVAPLPQPFAPKSSFTNLFSNLHMSSILASLNPTKIFSKSTEPVATPATNFMPIAPTNSLPGGQVTSAFQPVAPVLPGQ